MAKFIQHQIKRKYIILYVLSDLHTGSILFHQEALQEVICEVEKNRKAYIAIPGDLIEGKEIDSPHFNPEGLLIDEASFKFRDIYSAHQFPSCIYMPTDLYFEVL